MKLLLLCIGLSVVLAESSEEAGTELEADSNSTQSSDQSKAARIFPETIDWRTKGAVTAVRNQQKCNASWIFAAVGAVESRHAITTGSLLDLSEQQLLNCVSDENYGCLGGVAQSALDYASNSGITGYDNYPYEARKGTCDSTKIKAPLVKAKQVLSIKPNGEESLKEAVGYYGPVVVTINSKPLQDYKEGIFNSECSDDVDHSVLVVGYGKDSTGEYWILKNSLGTTWGEDGYFRLAMGKNLCGIGNHAVYPVM